MPWDLDIWEYDEARDGKYCWLSGAQWAWPPWVPLWFEIWYSSFQESQTCAWENFSHPTTKGWDWRVKDGGMYVSILMTTEEEQKQREPVWRERMAPILDDPFGYWEKYKPEMKQAYDRLIPFDVEKAGDMGLVDHLWDCWDWIRRMTMIHNTCLQALGQFVYLFQGVCQELTGIAASDVKFSHMMGGFDTRLFQANRGLAELAGRAVELGLRESFDTLEPEALLAKLEESDAGKKWLGEFRAYLNEYGHRPMRAQGIDFPTWLEKPSIPLADIKRMMTIGAVHAPDVMRDRLIKQREDTEKEVLAMVPAEQREWFAKLMKAAQAFSFYQEDHMYWCEFQACALLRRAAIEAGKRLKAKGVLDDPNDAVFMLRHEISVALSVGNRSGARDIVKRRKEEYDRYLKAEHPMIIGDPTDFMKSIMADPIIAIGGGPRVAEPEAVGATLTGSAGAPGIAEGPARVVMSIDDLGQLQPGEILVTMFTAAPWTPAFSIAKAVVTDVGGALAHAVIVGREYGIPVIVGTMEGTQKIKTGQKVRVDGDMLRVYVIE